MPVPAAGVPPELALFLGDLDARIRAFEAPKGFIPAFLTTSAALTSVTAKASGNTFAFATDLKTVVWSDGAHWYRADTGATIV